MDRQMYGSTLPLASDCIVLVAQLKAHQFPRAWLRCTARFVVLWAVNYMLIKSTLNGIRMRQKYMSKRDTIFDTSHKIASLSHKNKT